MTQHDVLYQETATHVLDEWHGEDAVLMALDQAPKPITIRVDRSAMEENLDARGTSGDVLICKIHKSDLPVLTEGADRVSLRPRADGPYQVMTVETRLNEVGGDWTLALK